MTFTTAVVFQDISALADMPAVTHVTSAALADGGFAVAGSGAFGTILRIFDATGAVERSMFIAGTDAEVCQTAAGNLTVATRDGTALRLTLIDGGNNVIVSDTTEFGTFRDFEMTATTGNQVQVAWTRQDIDPTGDVWIAGFDGIALSNSFKADDTSNSAVDVQITTLADGNLALAWQSGGSVQFEVMTVGGVVVKKGAVPVVGSFNAAFPAIVATETGFLVAYNSLRFEGASGLDVMIASYSNSGKYKGTINASDGLISNGLNDARAVFAKGPDGSIAMTWTSSNPETGSLQQHLTLLTSTDGQAVIGPITTFAGDGTVSFFGEGQIAAYLLDGASGSATGHHLTATTDSFGDGSAERFTGDDFNNLINGLGGNDTISAGKGRDDVLGGNGSDSLHGDDGNDTVSGESGNDKLAGDAGSDQVFGGIGNDAMTGGDGDDALFGDVGKDSLSGDAGNDAVSAGDGDDSINGVSGADTLDGGNGDDIILAGTENDQLIGGLGADTMLGGPGDDTLTGGAELDNLTGGQGADSFVLNSQALVDRDVITDFQSGQDHISLVAAVFAELGPTVTKGELRFGNTALDQDDHLIYIKSLGVLMYDIDANGATDAVQIASLGANTALVFGDILILG